MNTQIVEERIDSSQGMDIYDLSWYTYYLMEERGIPLTRHCIDSLATHLRELKGKEVFLHVLLYDKEIAVGTLLSYYILLKSKLYDRRSIGLELSEVLKVLESYIDNYSTQGEVLYVLKKLDTMIDAIRKSTNIDSRIRVLLSTLKSHLMTGKIRVEEVEDMSYLIWAVCEAKTFNVVEEDELIDIILNDRLYELVTADYRSISVYACAISSCVLNCRLKLKEKAYKALSEKVEQILKVLKSYDKELEHVEGVSKATIGKLKLSINNLEKSLQRLRALDEVRRTKRRCNLTIIAAVAAMIVFINILPLPVVQQVVLPFLFSNMYRSIITIILSLPASFLFIKEFFGDKVSEYLKILIECLKTLLEVILKLLT